MESFFDIQLILREAADKATAEFEGPPKSGRQPKK